MGIDGKTFQEIYDEGLLNGQNHKDLQKLIELGGMANFKVLEVVNTDDGYDAIVIEDEVGNINIFHAPTSPVGTEDIYYDLHKIFSYLLESGESYNLDESLALIEELAKELGYNDFDLDVFKESYETQERHTKELCDKYMQIIIGRNTTCVPLEKPIQLFFSGYSLGGSNSEIGYLYCNE